MRSENVDSVEYEVEGLLAGSNGNQLNAGNVSKAPSRRRLTILFLMLCVGVGALMVFCRASGKSEEISTDLLVGYEVFKKASNPAFRVADFVCVSRKRPSCQPCKGKDGYCHLKSTFEHLIENEIHVQSMHGRDKANITVIPGLTVLLSIDHGHSFMRWDNIAHYIQTIYPLSYHLELYGMRNSTRNAIVWQAKSDEFFGRQVGGFSTDWYEMITRFALGFQSDNTSMRHIHTCDDLPLLGARHHDTKQQCFEKLAVYEGGSAKKCPPSMYWLVGDTTYCQKFTTSLRDWIHLKGPMTTSNRLSVLTLIRVDSQGWSNYVEAVQKIRDLVQFHGNSADFIYLNKSKMTLYQQLSWFQRSDVVVTTHGAHLTNSMFQRPGSAVIEYLQKQWLSFEFSSAAVHCGVRYFAAHAKGTNFSRCLNHEFMNAHLPLDFEKELKPVLEMAMDGESKRCAFTAYGGHCADNFEEAWHYYCNDLRPNLEPCLHGGNWACNCR